jgi:16S rRNA (uracil1498-N3)-methyltransferase
MRRAFVDPEQLATAVAGEPLTLPKDAVHHLERVLRMREGEEVELFDGDGRLVRARLLAQGQVHVEEVSRASAPLPALVLAQARVRGPKLEEVVRRGAELGVAEVMIFDAERSQAPAARLDRLERVAQQAARQAERAYVPSLAMGSFDDVIAAAGSFEGTCAFGVVGAERALSEVLREAGGQGALLVVVGPEGGLSPAEQERLAAAGALPVGLGAHVLRTETAGLAALCAAQVAAGWL